MNKKGSVLLIVLVSMIFFLIVVANIYLFNKNKKQGQEKDVQQIQQTYNKTDEQMDEAYDKVIENQ